MPVKADVLEQLGETALILPDLVNRALTANDRIKYYLTLLQAARDHAAHPNVTSSLQAEREASGVDDPRLDGVVAGSALENEHQLHIPHARLIHLRIVDGMGQMLEPFKSADAGLLYERLSRRFQRLLSVLPCPENDRVPADYVDAVSRADGGGADSVHLLLMDLHRELNRLQMGLAIESLDGAKVYGIGEADRELVAAFMAGVNATAGLKFDHPGLGTTATRVGDRLIIQNDIGETDAHVLVVHVVDLTIRVVYTDVHPARVAFFQSLLEPLVLGWNTPSSDPAAGNYVMSVGELSVNEAADLRRPLTALGSRLVFLIDWNRARKRLSRILKKGDATAVLKWAADHNVGHRAFLQLGDVQLIDNAMARVARAQMRYGARLDEILGRESALAFVEDILKTTAEGLRNGLSTRLIEDEIQAELLTHVQGAEQGALNLAEAHAGLVAGLADLVRDAVARFASGADAGTLQGLAVRAKAWETRADDLVKQSRLLFEHAAPDPLLAHVLVDGDDVADALEEAAFLLTLAPRGTASGAAMNELQQLADLITSGARDYVRCVACGQDARLGGRAELEEFLVAVDAVMAFEHASDDLERAVKAVLIETCQDLRALYVLSEIAGCFESAADTLARCAIRLREDILNTLKVRG